MSALLDEGLGGLLDEAGDPLADESTPGSGGGGGGPVQPGVGVSTIPATTGSGADMRQRTQVITFDTDGGNPRLLGQLGHVTGLTYSFSCPGGPDQLTCTLQRDARWRSDALNPGRIVQAMRGASVVWDGTMLEPVPGPDGWAITCAGSGTYGVNFAAVYDGPWTLGVPDTCVNGAIGRGLRWKNPGIGNPTGLWLGQAVDSGAQTVTDLLNLCCSSGGLTWYVRRPGNTLSIFPLPTTPTRYLVSSTPVPRTLGGDVNTIWERYTHDADRNAPAVYKLTSSVDQPSIDAYGALETYLDLSSVGLMQPSAARTVGNLILQRYQRASFGGPFVVRHGELLNMGGAPVDLGMQQAGMVCRLMLTDFAYGGEVTPKPIDILVGAYEWDDDALTATITPFQSLDLSISGLAGNPWLMMPTDADVSYSRRERERDQDRRQRRRQEARRDRRQLRRWKRHHPHRRHHPKF